MRSLYLAIVFILLGASTVLADDEILLGEVLPALADTQLGAIEVGNAPPAGSTRTVRRSEILAALRRAGRSADGLAIPRSVQVSRESRVITRQDAEALALPAVNEVLAPCEVQSLHMPHDIHLASGPVNVHAQGRVPQRSGGATTMVTFRAHSSEVRVPVRAQVSCPPPAIAPGDTIQLVVHIGNVRASAAGESHQPGRIGEIIRVTNSATHVALQGRVIDANTVEVIQ